MILRWAGDHEGDVRPAAVRASSSSASSCGWSLPPVSRSPVAPPCSGTSSGSVGRWRCRSVSPRGASSTSPSSSGCGGSGARQRVRVRPGFAPRVGADRPIPCLSRGGAGRNGALPGSDGVEKLSIPGVHDRPPTKRLFGFERGRPGCVAMGARDRRLPMNGTSGIAVATLKGARSGLPAVVRQASRAPVL